MDSTPDKKQKIKMSGRGSYERQCRRKNVAFSAMHFFEKWEHPDVIKEIVANGRSRKQLKQLDIAMCAEYSDLYRWNMMHKKQKLEFRRAKMNKRHRIQTMLEEHYDIIRDNIKHEDCFQLVNRLTEAPSESTSLDAEKPLNVGFSNKNQEPDLEQNMDAKKWRTKAALKMIDEGAPASPVAGRQSKRIQEQKARAARNNTLKKRAEKKNIKK